MSRIVGALTLVNLALRRFPISRDADDVSFTTSTKGSSLLLLGISNETFARVGAIKIDPVDGAKTRTFTS